MDFFECSDASAACATGSWIQFGTDNSAPFSATWSTPVFDGPKAIRAVAVDAASNTGQHVRTITIDRTAPTGVTVTYPNGYVTGSYAITIEQRLRSRCERVDRIARASDRRSRQQCLLVVRQLDCGLQPRHPRLRQVRQVPVQRLGQRRQRRGRDLVERDRSRTPLRRPRL